MGGFPGTPPVYRVTNNRRLADAYAGAKVYYLSPWSCNMEYCRR